MLGKIALLVLLTFIPALELRFSIPVGILSGTVELPLHQSISGLGMHWLLVYVVCVLANILLGIMVYIIMDKVIHLFCRMKWFEKLYHKIVERAQKKIHPYVEKYGSIGVALFIGVPLPGSGVYTGGVGAYALGLSFRQFMVANVIGVLIAGTVVTLLTLGVVAL